MSTASDEGVVDEGGQWYRRRRGEERGTVLEKSGRGGRSARKKGGGERV